MEKRDSGQESWRSIESLDVEESNSGYDECLKRKAVTNSAGTNLLELRR